MAKKKVSYLFTTCNKDERGCIAHALNRVVTRLASKIIVGYKMVFGGFFSEFEGQGGEGKKSQRRKSRSNRSLYRIRKGPTGQGSWEALSIPITINLWGGSLCVNCLD